MRGASGARDTSARSTRARSETLRRRSTRTEVVAHVACPSHAENGQVPAQVAGVAQLAALQARLEHLAVRARARSRRQPGSTTRRRTARVCGAREARGALPRTTRRCDVFSSDFRVAREQRLKFRRDERDSKICRRGRIGVSHQGTRSAARGFRQRGAGFRALRAFAATDRVARRSRLERASNLRASVGDEPDTHTAAAAARCLAPAPTPCSARRRRSS